VKRFILEQHGSSTTLTPSEYYPWLTGSRFGIKIRAAGNAVAARSNVRFESN
jgi:hypothetical protein